MTHAIRIHAYGGPEVLRWEQVEVGAPGPGEVRLRHTAVGLNYLDVYHRTGFYALPSLPSGLGVSAAGVVEAVGPGVTGLVPGQRVAYATAPVGAYAEARLVPADRLVALPDGMDAEVAAASLMQGLTAEYLLRRTWPLVAGDTVLLHAAAGGVGLLFCQWARALGLTVVGTVSSREKAALARAHGCAHPLVLGEDDVVGAVRALTGGEGVAAVFDSVGRDTLEVSLACLRQRGLLASFGQASGLVPPLELNRLGRMGSLFVTRPSVYHYCGTPAQLAASAEAFFGVVARGEVRVEVRQRFALCEAAAAHEALEGRRTTGSSVLVP